MPTSMLLEERPLQSEDDHDFSTMAVPEGPSARRGLGRRMPVLVMAAGLAFMVVAALVLVRAGGGGDPAVDPSAITVSARDISVVTQVYEPGQTSGWHSHPGIHAVSVTSGVLTVHVSGCPARTFEPGRPYVGGQEPHLVANEGDVPVTMTVTYLNPASPAAQGAAPSGCPAA